MTTPNPLHVIGQAPSVPSYPKTLCCWSGYAILGVKKSHTNLKYQSLEIDYGKNYNINDYYRINEYYIWIHIGLFECILSFNTTETMNAWINIYYI